MTALDWDPNYNRILSCSEDCNAYVWNYEDGKWIPTLVVLKIKRAALCCKWSPNGKAFAVGSSERKRTDSSPSSCSPYLYLQRGSESLGPSKRSPCEARTGGGRGRFHSRCCQQNAWKYLLCLLGPDGTVVVSRLLGRFHEHHQHLLRSFGTVRLD